MKPIWKKGGLLAAVLALLLAVATACGPKADVPIFMMFPQNSPFNKQDELKKALQEMAGEAPTVNVSISPIFDLQKMVVELAAGDWSIYVLPQEQFEGFKKEGGFVPLDDVLKKEDFPDGVSNGELVGIPLKDSKLLKDAGYKGGEVYAFLTQRVKEAKRAKAKQVLKLLAER
ncbi:hypothetical protein [Paenibacillus ginsengarvi]|uniref:Extracellular solute-binding protein n=1 Tax=Paenibacillus ginsengarvi TaxID=400777 RepID=A0A3B0BNQ0_9BACL|nr:hypothetical protein [Paenibacillus ginsengarvi]RKN72966.1 hypothetical protein D7M11_27845 [Paenibacillus ginsengarvi]